MNGPEILRIVDAIHRDKGIAKEIIFEGISLAILSAARKHFGEEAEIFVDIDRETGQPSVKSDGEELEPDEIGDLLGRIAAQTAKQVMIQKIREAERDALFDEFTEMRGQMLTGSISRIDGGTAMVNIGKIEGILPRGEQIPGEFHRVGERIRSIVMDVRKVGSRVRIILSRRHPELVRRLFETEIPEVSERVIEVRSLAREAGYRSKVAVSCFDSKIDCVGACVGVRGARIKGIVDELAGERIDIVRWNDSLQVLVPNALQPAEVEDVILCPMLGKVIVLVHDDQLSLAIGKKGQNVRLASKLVGWDIHVMNQEKLDEQLGNSVAAFSTVPEVSDELAESLVEQGFFTFDDLSVIEPDQLAELGGLTSEQCDVIVAHADKESARIEAEEIRAMKEARARRELEKAAPPKPEVAETEVSEEVVSEEAVSEEERPAAVSAEGELREQPAPSAEGEESQAQEAEQGETETGEVQEILPAEEEADQVIEEPASEESAEVQEEPETPVAQSELVDPGEVTETESDLPEPGSPDVQLESASSAEGDGEGEQLSKAEASKADE